MMSYRNKSNKNIRRYFNDSSNIYEIFNNTKKIEKHFNKKLHHNLINSNLNELGCNKNIKNMRNLKNENRNIICSKKRNLRKSVNIDLINSRFNSTNISSRNNTPINTKTNLSNFSNVNENNSPISKNRPYLKYNKSINLLKMSKNKDPIKFKNYKPYINFKENFNNKNLIENERTFRHNNIIINTNEIFEKHFIKNKNDINTPIKPIRYHFFQTSTNNNDNKINKIVFNRNPNIKKMCLSKTKFSKDKKECKGKNTIKSNSFLYEDNEDFLLRFKLDKIKIKKYISIECLNTKKISKESEMFSNTYEIGDILNISEIPPDLDLIEEIKKLIVKYPPSGIFNEEQKEFNLKITYDNNIKNMFILVQNKCKDNEFIKKNIDKKNNQDKKKRLRNYKN